MIKCLQIYDKYISMNSFKKYIRTPLYLKYVSLLHLCNFRKKGYKVLDLRICII